MRIKVGEHEFKVKVANTPDKRKRGLRGIKEMPEGHGLLMTFEESRIIPIAMNGMKIPLDVVFIQDSVVQEVKPLQVLLKNQDKSDFSIASPSDAVLELNMGEGGKIRPGDKVTYIGEKNKGGKIKTVEGGVKVDEEAMQLLDENGQVQMNIKGNERVFSRVHTGQLIKLAEQANDTKTDTDYKKVGRAIIRMINKQDTQEQQYTEN